MIGHWIVSYESLDSQLEGAEGVEPIKPLVESEPLGLLWSVSEIEHEILIINIFQIIDMVPQFFNFLDRPN